MVVFHSFKVHIFQIDHNEENVNMTTILVELLTATVNSRFETSGVKVNAKIF